MLFFIDLLYYLWFWLFVLSDSDLIQCMYENFNSTKHLRV